MSIQGSGQTFLHGYLVIQVKEAKDIPDMENWYSKLYDKKDVTDPFVDVKLGKARYFCYSMFDCFIISPFTRIAKTAVIFNDLNPKWEETFLVNKENKMSFKFQEIPLDSCLP